MAGALIGGHVGDQLHGGGLQSLIRHDQTDGGGGACHEAEGLSHGGAKGGVQRLARGGGVGEFQVARGVDVDLARVALRQLQGDLHGLSRVGDVAAGHDDIVTVTAPALGVAGQLHGYEGGVGVLQRLIHGADLTCRARAGADDAQGGDALGEIHLSPQGGVYGGDHQTDGVQHRPSHKLGEGGGGVADVVHRVPFMYVKWRWVCLSSYYSIEGAGCQGGGGKFCVCGGKETSPALFLNLSIHRNALISWRFTSSQTIFAVSSLNSCASLYPLGGTKSAFFFSLTAR